MIPTGTRILNDLREFVDVYFVGLNLGLAPGTCVNRSGPDARGRRLRLLPPTPARSVPDETIADYHRTGILRVLQPAVSADIRRASTSSPGSSKPSPRAVPRPPGFTQCWASINGSSPVCQSRRKSMSGATIRTLWPRPLWRHGKPRSATRADGGCRGSFRFRPDAGTRSGPSSAPNGGSGRDRARYVIARSDARC